MHFKSDKKSLVQIYVTFSLFNFDTLRLTPQKFLDIKGQFLSASVTGFPHFRTLNVTSSNTLSMTAAVKCADQRYLLEVEIILRLQ